MSAISTEFISTESGPVDVAALIRAASADDHRATESRGFITRLMGGGLSLSDYARYLVQYAHVYEALESRAGFFWRASASAFGYDALVYRIIVRPTVVVARTAWAFIDRWLIDGTVEGAAAVVRWISTSSSDMQSGDVQWYGAVIVVGIALMLAMSVWLGR